MGSETSQVAKPTPVEEPQGIQVEMTHELTELLEQSDRSYLTDEVIEKTQRRRYISDSLISLNFARELVSSADLQLHLPKVEDISVDTEAQEKELSELAQDAERRYNTLKSELDEAFRLSQANKAEIQKVKEEFGKATHNRCQVEQDLLARCKRDTPLLCRDYLDRYLTCVNNGSGKQE